MKAIQWFPSVHIDGVLRLPAQTIDTSATRGITFKRAERHVVNTATAQIELAPGDWVLTYPSGNQYVMKDVDYAPRTAETPWGRFMKKWGKK